MSTRPLSLRAYEQRTIYPPVVQVIRDWYGNIIEYRERFDPWRINESGETQITLQCIQSGHTFPLGLEHIGDDMSNPRGARFLVLKSRVFMDGANVHVVPIVPYTSPRTYARRILLRRRALRAHR